MNTNPNSLRNLKRGGQPTKWKNTPTKVVRIPTIFEPQILSFAEDLDNGRSFYPEICNNRSVQNDCHSILLDILNKINNRESGYKANSASKLIADLKKLGD
jgi:hypothetical protein